VRQLHQAAKKTVEEAEEYGREKGYAGYSTKPGVYRYFLDFETECAVKEDHKLWSIWGPCATEEPTCCPCDPYEDADSGASKAYTNGDDGFFVGIAAGAVGAAALVGSVSFALKKKQRNSLEFGHTTFTHDQRNFIVFESKGAGYKPI